MFAHSESFESAQHPESQNGQFLLSREQWEFPFFPCRLCKPPPGDAYLPAQTLAVRLGTWVLGMDIFMLKLSLWNSFQHSKSTWCQPEVCDMLSPSPQWFWEKWCCCLEGVAQGTTPRSSPSAHFVFHFLLILAVLPGPFFPLCFLQMHEDIS